MNRINRRKMLLTSTATTGGLFLATKSWARETGDGFQEITDASRKSLRKGTDWLKKAINKDGGAGLDIGTPSDVCCTSVVGLALLSQGNTPVEGQLHKQQAALTEFLLRRAEKMTVGGSMQRSRSQIEGDLGPFATHFFSTLFLSSAMGESRNLERFRFSLRRLERYISANQQSNGSWGTDAWAPMLATAVGWVSLRAANFAGIRVSGSSEKAGDFLVQNMPRLGRRWGSGSWYHRLYGTAAGLRVLYALKRDHEKKAQTALKDILVLLETNANTFGGAGGEEYLTFHLMTEMLMQKGGPQWKRWYENVRDKLIAKQNRDGSWTGHHCITSRTFSTACALMVLSAPNRYLPVSAV